jgi:hypothetical protein
MNMCAISDDDKDLWDDTTLNMFDDTTVVIDIFNEETEIVETNVRYFPEINELNHEISFNL